MKNSCARAAALGMSPLCRISAKMGISVVAVCVP